jgi:hypothetical protein
MDEEKEIINLDIFPLSDLFLFDGYGNIYCRKCKHQTIDCRCCDEKYKDNV